MDGDDGTWAGDAARAFRASLDDGFRPQLSDVHEAFGSSRDALSAWANELDGFQSRARDLENEASLAAGALDRRHRERAQARSDALADPIAAAGSTDLADADRRARAAEATLDGIRRRARALEAEADARAIACAHLLEAGGLALGGALGKVGKALGDGTRQVLVPTISGGGGALAAAGGGTAAAGSLTMAIRFSPQALQANTMWMATKMTARRRCRATTSPAHSLSRR